MSQGNQNGGDGAAAPQPQQPHQQQQGGKNRRRRRGGGGGGDRDAARLAQQHQQPRAGRKADAPLPSELRVRDYVAKMQLKALKKMASLANHTAADTGRRNKDWKHNTGSADLNIIPETPIIDGRSRQMVRDNWAAKSIVRAYKRNISGRGIAITPHAKLPDGSPFTALNVRAAHQFRWWGRTKEACDVEKRQTFNQMQRLAVGEKVTVGQHFWVWSYAPPLTPAGKIDLSRPCGMSIQRFEPEQLDYRILSFEEREVRGGIELGENGEAVAYHFYTRNPNDYLYRRAFWSRRIPRDRVWHYAEQERVLQTHGVTPLTCVLQDLRDYGRLREASLWRAVMEACIGVIFKKQFPTPAGSPMTLGPFQQSDPTGQTPSGMRTADFVPGMAIEALPGEDVVPFTPQAGGNLFQSFTEDTIRGVGAGAGMSYGQISRRSEGSYSSARQDMLEDRKEWEPEQDLVVDDLLRPAYELWFTFAALEGRFDDVPDFELEKFLAERVRYVDAEYIPPPQTWIDPEKEANAFAILLKNRLITREEIIAMRGERFYAVTKKIASEQTELNDLNLTLPENADERKDVRELLKAMIQQQLTAGGTAAWLDVPKTIERGGLAGNKQPKPLAPPPAPAGDGAGDSGQSDQQQQQPRPATAKKKRSVKLAQVDAPDYRPCDNPAEKCATCSFLVGEHCRPFDFDVDLNHVCNAWAAEPISRGEQVTKGFPPGPQDGQKSIDRDFQPAADTTPTP